MGCSSGWATARRVSREPRRGHPPGGGGSIAPATTSPERPQCLQYPQASRAVCDRCNRRSWVRVW
eukprot:10204471-Alexandrium_andersonii.AAC.1